MSEGGEATFRRFVLEVEPRLRQALVALYGPARGREATIEALSWAWDHKYLPAHPDDPEVLRHLFLVAQRRSARLDEPSIFDQPTRQDSAIEPDLLAILGLLPRRDRVALLLREGAGWDEDETDDLLEGRFGRHLGNGRARARNLPGVARAGAALAERTAFGDLTSERLGPLFSGSAADPVTAEEAMNAGLARVARDEPPELASSRRVQLLKVAGLCLALLVLLVVGLVIGIGATRSTTVIAYTTPGPEPAPGDLADTVVVVPNRPGAIGSVAGSGAVSYEVDAGTLLPVRAPGLGDFAATSSTVTSGGYVAAVVYTKDASSGRAIDFRTGSLVERDLGPATQVLPGLEPGTFWLRYHGAQLDGGPKGECAVRLESASGRRLGRPATIPCAWEVFGAVRGGLLVVSSTGATEFWNPTTRLTVPIPYFSATSMQAVGGTLVSPQWNLFCALRCRLLWADPATGVLTHTTITPPGSSSLTTAVAISPNGRYLAMIGVPIDDAAGLQNRSFFSSSAPRTKVIHGLLLIVRIATGQVAVSRPAIFQYPSLVEWSPDGSYVFLTRSATEVTAFPAWSTSVPSVVVSLPTAPTEMRDAGDGFLLASH
jgi:hypothetical protein